ncbi:NAD-dependent protein deacetylase [soil metagenome]
MLNPSSLVHPLNDPSLAADLDRLFEITASKRDIVAFTGAGISTESGIPDYRGPNGVWATQKPPTLGDFRSNPETRREYWENRFERYPVLASTRPNEGHIALTRLRKAGLLSYVITQNIDGLHQDAGIEPDRVLELHGTAREVKCLDCDRRWDAESIHQRQADGDMAPGCEVCGGPLRAATVLFGEPLPNGAIESGMEISRQCDLMLAVGSSLIVQPAAKIPLVAKRAGAALAILNLSETPLDAVADLVVRGPAGIILKTLAHRLVP